MQTDSQQPSAPPGSAPPGGSADGRGYAKGYAAGIKRVKQLEAEIARLNEIKTPPPLPDSHDTTIEYLITTAEAMIGAANMLMAMRNPPNDPSSPTATGKRPKSQSNCGASGCWVQRVVSEQTFADQIRLAGKVRKYSKRQLVAELLESDRMLRSDARQINALGDEVKRLKELLANDGTEARGD